jgi:prepilin-type N-terminal cleavage/methylation domain-containing protein/prepilin-type processing-associated H-X9-DG protein
MRALKEKCMGRRGFTLVEILVVIGVIAVLMAILLPTLSLATESSRRVSCASQLRQVGAALTAYVNENRGEFPYAPRATANDADALWWQPARVREIGNKGIGPYLNLRPDDLRMFRCPTDSEAATRQAAGRYPLTYVFNSNLNGNGIATVRKINQVKDSTSVVWVYEENGVSIDDGNGTLWNVKGTWGNIGMLGLRHDHKNRRQYPDASSAVTGIPNLQGRGNLLFVDGHVEYLERAEAHKKEHALPNPSLYANEPDIGP